MARLSKAWELGRRVWREVLVRELPSIGLIALRAALREDSPRLTRGITVSPLSTPSELPTKMCAIAFALNAGCGPFCVSELVEVYLNFADRCERKILRHIPGAQLSSFFQWYDHADWSEVKQTVLETIDERLSQLPSL